MSYLLYYYTGIIMLPVFIFALICQAKVKTNFNRYSQIMNRSGMTGADAAWRLLQLNGITDVKIKRISGTLTDYYDPNKKDRKFALARMYLIQGLLPLSVLRATRRDMRASIMRDIFR